MRTASRALQSAVTGAAVDLTSQAAITSNAAAIVTADTLTGNSAGRAAFSAANKIATLGAFATHDGTFSLTDAATLTVDSALNAGTGDLILTTTGAGHDLAIDGTTTGRRVKLNAAGAITETASGAVKAKHLDASAVTGISLSSSKNDIAAVGTDHTNSGPNVIDRN